VEVWTKGSVGVFVTQCIICK